MALSASCHCGDIQIEVAEKPRALSECNCSICRRYGAKWAYYTQGSAKVSYAPGKARAYTWGEKTIEFYHCDNCGCLTHYETLDKSENARLVVNARMMSPGDIEGIKVKLFDGADTWKFVEE